MPDLVFGEVPAVPVGSAFRDRESLSKAGVHRPNQGGIGGRQGVGADSIVVSGGYQDDEDLGDLIIYTGQGGRDGNTGLQVADQELTRGNLALARSCDEGLPVRVVRGAGGDPTFSPSHGYRYDGLYFVTSYWSQAGTHGFRIWRFRLERNPADQDVSPSASPLPAGDDTVPTYSAVQRMVRNTAVTQAVKDLYDHTCQICGTRLETSSGPYAEGCHVIPRGKPHHGPDTPANVLCLCPNCHVRFDRGGFYIDGDLTVVDALDDRRLGRLSVRSGHGLDTALLVRQRLLLAS